MIQVSHKSLAADHTMWLNLAWQHLVATGLSRAPSADPLDDSLLPASSESPVLTSKYWVHLGHLRVNESRNT